LLKSSIFRNRNFSITPNYRVYFSNKYARGFFVEGFGMLHRYRGYFYTGVPYSDDYVQTKKLTNFSIGISLGNKWVTKKGFVAEIFGGLGRNLLNFDDKDPSNLALRGGISFGKRF